MEAETPIAGRAEELTREVLQSCLLQALIEACLRASPRAYDEAIPLGLQFHLGECLPCAQAFEAMEAVFVPGIRSARTFKEWKAARFGLVSAFEQKMAERARQLIDGR